MNNRYLLAMSRQPTQAIAAGIWVFQLLIALIIFSPWYTLENTPTLAAGLGDIRLIRFYGVLLFINGTVGLFFLWRDRRALKKQAKNVMFASFLLITFFAILRLSVFGVFNPVWLSYLLNAFIAAVVHLRLKLESGD